MFELPKYAQISREELEELRVALLAGQIPAWLRQAYGEDLLAIMEVTRPNTEAGSLPLLDIRLKFRDGSELTDTRLM